MAWTVANLALAAYEFKETHIMYGQWDVALRNIGWAIDWLAKAHVVASSTPTANVFVGQVSGWGVNTCESEHVCQLNMALYTTKLKPDKFNMHAVNPLPCFLAIAYTDWV